MRFARRDRQAVPRSDHAGLRSEVGRRRVRRFPQGERVRGRWRVRSHRSAVRLAAQTVDSRAAACHRPSVDFHIPTDAVVEHKERQGPGLLRAVVGVRQTVYQQVQTLESQQNVVVHGPLVHNEIVEDEQLCMAGR